jgi:hypothetical protein
MTGTLQISSRRALVTLPYFLPLTLTCVNVIIVYTVHQIVKASLSLGDRSTAALSQRALLLEMQKSDTCNFHNTCQPFGEFPRPRLPESVVLTSEHLRAQCGPLAYIVYVRKTVLKCTTSSEKTWCVLGLSHSLP